MARRLDMSLMVAFLAGTAGVAPSHAQTVDPLREERLLPGNYPAAPVPAEFAPATELGHPPFEIDWSVGLRGTYTHATTGETFATTLTPQFTATHNGQRADLTLSGGAELAKTGGDGTVTFTGANIGFDITAPLDAVTTATANGALRMTQELQGTPGLNSAIVTPPKITTGSLGAGVTRKFGLFNVGVNGTATRTENGETLRSDTGLTSNRSQNNWNTAGTMRVGYQVTPIFEVYGQAGVGRTIFDLPADGTTQYRNATERSLRGGLAAEWNEALTANFAVGVGEYNFDDAALADIRTELYEANLTFRPDPTLALTAGLSTTITPPGADSTGTARVSHAANANVNYTVNSWLRLRASADVSRAVTSGSGETESRWGVGAGADYQLNAHTALNADYGFSHRDNSTTGLLDAHRVSVGVTVHR